MWIGILLGIPLGLLQVFCMKYYISGLDKQNKRDQWKLSRMKVGLLNALVLIAFIVGFAIFDANSLLFAVTAMCGTMILLTIVKFIRNMSMDEEK